MMFWKRSLDTTTARYQERADPLSKDTGMPHKHAWDVNFWPEWDDPDDPSGSFSMRAYQWAMGILKKP